MTYPQSGQYPSYPQYPGGGQMPVPAKPPIPSTVQNAFYLMVAGAVLAVVGGILTISETSTIRSQVESRNRDFSTTQVDTAVHVAVAAAVVGIVIGAGLWLWMAFANRAGKNYARITGTVFFGIATLSTLGGLAASPGSSMASVKTNALSVVVSVLGWLVGLVTVVLLWNKQSGPYFKPEQAYGYGYPQPPAQYPYPQQPPQGQQQSPYPTPPQMQPPNDPWSTNPPQ
ncbi:MAG TPA: hypothetical protein VFU73_12150 [Actinocrinis sp.]|nr:hypothetical protein [Actinocrinis sp.]